MLTEIYTKRMKKDMKLIKKQNKNKRVLEEVINKLKNKEQLDKKYEDHSLLGDYEGCRECHLGFDWLLIYEIDEETNTLKLVRTGTHTELFESLNFVQVAKQLSEFLGEKWI